MATLYHFLLSTFLFCSAFTPIFCKGQTIDSLLFVLQTSKDDLSNEGVAELLYNLGVAFHEEDEYSQAHYYFNRSLEVSQREGYDWLTMENNYNLGAVCFWQADYQSSVKYLNKALNDFPHVNTLEDSIFIIDQLGHTYFYMGDLDLALEQRLLSLELTNRFGDSTYIAESYFAIAEIQAAQNLFEPALKYLMQSKAIAEAIGSETTISYCLDLMGDIAHEKGEYNEALDYKTKACEALDTKYNNYHQAYCDHTLALTYAQMEDHDRAISLYARALAKREQTGQVEEATETKACLGEMLALEGQCGRGIRMMQESLNKAKQLEILPLQKLIYHKLFLTAKHCGKFEQAMVFQEKYFAVRDSINDQNALMKIANFNAKQELTEKGLELDILQKDKQLNQLYILVMSGTIAFLLVSAMFIYGLFKKQKKYNDLQGERAASMLKQNAALEWANHQLKNANGELEQFAYLASHDLKAPLRTIGSYASLIKRRYRDLLDDDGKTFLQFITGDVKHMNALLEDILAYSNVDKNSAGMEHVDLNEKIHLALRMLDSTIREKDAKVEMEPLPVVNGHATQLFQVFQNLIDNALKFIPEDRQPHIKIGVEEMTDKYQFCISDNGIGIDPEEQEKVFTLFKRLHSKDEYRGTGIGLAICKKIVEKHGGTIWVESDGKTGTTFFFTIKKMEQEVAMRA